MKCETNHHCMILCTLHCTFANNYKTKTKKLLYLLTSSIFFFRSYIYLLFYLFFIRVQGESLAKTQGCGSRAPSMLAKASIE